MRLQDYFKEEQKIKLSNAEKLSIYNKIFSKPQKVSIFKKSSFYFKTVGCFAILLIFFISFYIPYIQHTNLPDNNLTEKKYGTGYIAGKIENSVDIVKASPIGKIIEINGGFSILKDGEEVDSNIIEDGDVVMLFSGSSMKFEVNSGATANIQGPAKFTLQTVSKDEKNVYVLDLIYGQYFEIKSNKSTEDQIIVKTDKMEVQLENENTNNSNIDFSITTKGDTQILSNKGAKLVVKKIIDNKEVKSEIKTNQKAEIDEQIKILQEVKKIETEIKEDKLENSYALTGEQEENTEQIDYSVFTGTIKKSLDEDKMDGLKQIIYPSFIQKDLEAIYVSHANGKQDSLNLAGKTYLSRLSKVSKLLGIDLDPNINEKDTVSVNNLYVVTRNLETAIENKYYIPPEYTNRLKKAADLLGDLNNYKFGTFSKENLDFEAILVKMSLTQDSFIIN